MLSLQPICDRYAALLSLDAWTIIARYASPGEMKPGSVGQLNWRQAAGVCTAEVLLEPATTHDHEVTVAHELCHIPLLTCAPRGARALRDQEHAIDQFAIALVKQHRARHCAR